jgi:nitrite reductase/ring-hydroxylating ferredoxin subunit
MRPILRGPAERLHGFGAVDSIADALYRAVYAVVPNETARKDLLAGTWHGHPLHPALTDVTVGSWIGAFVLDLFGDESADGAADALIGLGALSAIPTAASGLVDWSDTGNPERRVGVVHAAGNVTALLMYGVAFVLRRAGMRRAGRRLSFAAFATATASAYLGGHMAYGRGVGVDQTVFETQPTEWTSVMSAEELPEGKPGSARVDGTTLVLYRAGDRILALSARCSHRGGPLHEGEIDDGELSVTCPWHGSMFDLETGDVLRGPATAPQPAYEARTNQGRIEVRLRVRG